jgi:diguanylate cyclase
MRPAVRKALEGGRGTGAQVAALWLLAALAYGVLAATTIRLTSDGVSIATVWPCNAVLVALLLVGRKPRWATVLSAGLAGNLLANWATRGTVAGPLLYTAANGLEVAVAVALLRARLPRPSRVRDLGRLFRFVAAAGIAAPLASGLVGAATARLVYGQDFATALATWLLSDSLGLLVFTPVFRSVASGELAAFFADSTGRRRVEALALFALVAAMAWGVFFAAPVPALFILYAPVMLVTFRVGPLGTKLAVMTVAVIGAFATAHGHGPLPMISGDPATQAHMFQASLAVMLLTCLPVAAEIGERSRLAAELRAREQKAAEEAATDPLTGVLNRRGFERAAAAVLDGAPGGAACCIAIDVDRFKAINDRWGHAAGDGVLAHVAATLQAHTRPGDLIGRLGGDEFAVLLRTGDARGAEAVCARVQAALRTTPAGPEAAALAVGISCGVAATWAGDRLKDVFRRADAALYAAKQGGRDAVRLAAAA